MSSNKTICVYDILRVFLMHVMCKYGEDIGTVYVLCMLDERVISLSTDLNLYCCQ